MSRIPRVCPTCQGTNDSGALFCPRDGSPLSERAAETRRDPYLGLAIGDGLRLERLVGLGAMGRVYRAHQAALGRSVAVKILNASCCKDATLVARFEREGRVAASISHPNVVSILDAGRLPERSDTTDGEPFLVMEYLDGHSLRAALAASGGAIGLHRSLHVVLQLADALGQAHEQGIVHRDVKPENVMLVKAGLDPDFAKVLDFGVARVGEGDTSIATHAGAVLGTATYACPESARGDRVGPAGNVYALSTLLFECLAGRPPFVGKSPVDVLIQHAQSGPPDVRDFPDGAATPAPIAALIAENLRKHPSERAQSARALGRDLASAALACALPERHLAVPATLLGVERTPQEAVAPRLEGTPLP